MASKQVQDLLVRLKIDGLEGLDSLKGAFRELAKTIGPTEQTIEKARQSIIEFGEAGNKSEQLIKGQIEAFKGLRSQATQGGKVYKELTADIKKLEGAAYGASPAVEAQRKALTALGLSADATASQIGQTINSLINLRGEVRVDSQAFDNFGKSIAELTNRFRAVNQEAQNFAQAQQRIARPIGATSAAARQQIRDLDLVTESLREQRDALSSLEGTARIRAGAAGLAERRAPAAGRRTFEEAVAESLFGGDIKKLLPAKDIKAALDEVAREIANFQQQIETKLSRKIQISFQETARAARESARAMAAAFSDPELINVFNQFDQRLGELPDTTTGLNQKLSELSQRLVNTKRNTVDYLVVAMQMAGVQRELTAVTQGYAQALLMGIRTGTVAPSARNLQEVITALRAEMDQLDVTTSEGARAYAENAREARSLEQRLKRLADAYRHVGDMAAQAATAETSAATARITANYLNRPLIRQQEEAMAELGRRVRAGVAGTPLALPAAGQTTAPGTGLQISGGARAGRPSPGILRFFTRADIGDAGTQMPGAPQAYGPQATEQQAERARRAAISEAEAIKTAAEARQQAERQIQSYRAEIDKARRADIGSIDSTQRLRGAIDQYRSTLPGASAEFKKLTKELGELDARSEKLGRGLARRRMTGMQMAQAAGAALSGGIFGGPEGFLGGAIGTAVGGVGGAFAGAAIGAQIGGLRKQLGGFADYAAQIQKMEIALKNAAGGQAEFNQAVAAANSAVRNLNVPQDVAIQGMTRLTAAVVGAKGSVSDAELVFKNVTSAIKATGGSAQDVDGAITAMVQVFSKGKVSAEELSGQLGERLPGAVTKFAEANKMSLPELQKALEQGQVGLNELMNFIVQLGDEYSGVAEKIAGSSQDAGARLTVAFNEMRIAVGEALQPVGAQFQEAFAEFIRDITPAVVAASKAIGQGIKFIVDNASQVGAIVELTAKIGLLVVGLNALKAAISAVMSLNLVNYLTAATTSAKITGDVMAVTATKAGLLSAAIGKLKIATVALAAAWGPALILTVGIAGAVATYNWIQKLKKATDNLKQVTSEAAFGDVWFKNIGGLASSNKVLGRETSKALQQVSDLTEKLKKLKGEEKALSSLASNRLSADVAQQAQVELSAVQDQIKATATQLYAQKRNVEVGMKELEARTKRGIDVTRDATSTTESDRFPSLTGDGAGAGSKAKKERESQLPQLMAQLAMQQQIAQINEKIRNAQLAENQFLQIRLEGERELAQIAGEIAALAFEKIPADEAEVKRKLLMLKADEARENIVFRMRQIEKQNLIEITQQSDDLAKSYTTQIEDRQRLQELIATGMKEALALEYIQIENILEKEKERLEVRKALLEAAGDVGGAQDTQDLIDRLGGKETGLKDLAAAAQPEEKGKLQQFIEQAEAELKDLEALAVRISQNIGNAVGNSIANGITGLIEGTTTAKEVFANFLKDVGQILIQEGAKMIATYIAIGIAKIFAGLSSGGGGGGEVPGALGQATNTGLDTGAGNLSDMLSGLAAKGAYFSGGQANFAQNSVRPFAMGGIVTKPTFFKYADGGTFNNGVMGEAGPEAIMPLKRGADGKLGVAARLDGAMKRYRSTPGSAAAAAEGDAAALAAAGAAPSGPIDVRYTVERINSVDYVTADQFQAGMHQAAEQGARRGEQRALTNIRQNTNTRRRLGL